MPHDFECFGSFMVFLFGFLIDLESVIEANLYQFVTFRRMIPYRHFNYSSLIPNNA